MEHPTSTRPAPPCPGHCVAVETLRHATYKNIHKGLRGMMLETLLQVGRMDPGETAECHEALAAVETLLHALETHAQLENAFLHTALRERAPYVVAQFDRVHGEHRRAIAALQDCVNLVRRGGSGAHSCVYRLYLELSGFVADNLQHMLDEESIMTQALWDHFSDAEIRALESRLTASVPPELAAMLLQWMGRCLSHPERVELFHALRSKAPAVAAAGLELLRRQLDPDAWTKLRQAVYAADTVPPAGH